MRVEAPISQILAVCIGLRGDDPASRGPTARLDALPRDATTAGVRRNPTPKGRGKNGDRMRCRPGQGYRPWLQTASVLSPFFPPCRRQGFGKWGLALFAAAFLSLVAAGADAACTRPDPSTEPAVPNGAKADEADMKAAHDGLQAYVVLLEAYKACLKDQADNAPADTPEEVKATWLAQGDAALDAANYVANQFSYALKTYKARTTPAESASKP